MVISKLLTVKKVKKLNTKKITIQKIHTWSSSTCACFGFDVKINEKVFQIGIDVFPEHPVGFRFGLNCGIAIQNGNYKELIKVDKREGEILEKEGLELVEALKRLLMEVLEENEKQRLYLVTGEFKLTETADLSRIRKEVEK